MGWSKNEKTGSVEDEVAGQCGDNKYNVRRT